MITNRPRVTLDTLRACKAAGRRFSMLTAYDFPLAVAAEHAGVHSLLIGDSMGNVVLGQESTRDVPLELMLTLGTAVRRGAPSVFLVGDLPYVSVHAGLDAALRAADRFRDECGCDAIKLELLTGHDGWIERLVAAGHVVVAHLGLRPQTITRRSDLRAQARDPEGVAALTAEAVRAESAGAQLLLLEAVPNEASQAVVSVTRAPVIGCGAGSACDGHVVVTHDMLGLGAGGVPKFVKVLSDIGARIESAMAEYVREIETGAYPAPEHTYALRKPAASRS